MAINFNKIYQFKTTKPNINDYWNLFNSTGWNTDYKFKIEELNMALENSFYSISAYEEDKLIGFGRIISDGIHHALIVDLIILPEFKNKGIGSRILMKLLKKCKEDNIRDIQLFSAKDKYSFYERFGFVKRETNAPGMEYKYER